MSAEGRSAGWLKPSLLAAGAGALTVLGFAPARLFLLPVLAFAFLIVLWRRAAAPHHAALIGFSFGLGFFLGGVSWVYVSLHDFGAMPALLAGVLTLLLCCYLALFPAFTGWIYHRLGRESALVTIVALPALWTLTEWLRGWLFTGFPWNALGYSQIPASPLAGYVPVLGVYAVSYLIVLSAALLAIAVPRRATASGRRPMARLAPAIALVMLAAAGYALKTIEWTRPEGQSLTVTLLQGNVAQEMKWRSDKILSTLVMYRDLITASPARLIILPETALPLFLEEVPREYIEGIAAHARSHHADVLIGIPERDSERNYYNSVLSLGASPTQVYRKVHLVPFGEFVPLKWLFGWFLEVTEIPLLDFARGSEAQQPLLVAGQRVAVNICYEDAFGNEIIRQLPQATLLVNASNVAWFGRSIAPQQHLQISQTRALETGRYMLRATNTGMTAIIDQRGHVRAVAPQFEAVAVTGEVQGYAGTTPFVRWGNYPIILAMTSLLAIVGWIQLRRAGKIAPFLLR